MDLTTEPSGLQPGAAKSNNASVNSETNGMTSFQCPNNTNTINGDLNSFQMDDSFSNSNISCILNGSLVNKAGTDAFTACQPDGDMLHSFGEINSNICSMVSTQKSSTRSSQRIASQRSTSVGGRPSSKQTASSMKRPAGNLVGISKQATKLIKKSNPPKKQTPYQSIPTSAVTVSNRFEMDDAAEVKTPQNIDSRSLRGTAATARKAPRPPPLTLTNHQGKEVDKLLYNSGVKLSIKITAAGTRVFPADEEGRQHLAELLKSKQIPFYTHPPKSSGVLRVILKGLLKKLQEVITDILQYRVKWECPRTKPVGPTICRRCAMLGHGMSNCFRAPVCLGCAGEHAVDECPFNSQEKENNALALCCVNCKARGFHSNHRADDTGCFTRAQFMELRSNALPNKRNAKPPSQQAAHWPLLGSRKQTSAKNNSFEANLANQRATQHNSPSNGSPFKQNQKPVFTNASYANAVIGERHTRPSNQNSSELLFSADEIINITLNAIDQIQACNSKLEQLRIVAQLLSQCI